jgi:hypothetical protein
MSHLLRHEPRHFPNVPRIVGQARDKYEPDPNRFSDLVQALGEA